MDMARVTVDLPEDQVPTVAKTSMTQEAYEAFCAANPDLRIEREPSGEVARTGHPRGRS